MLKPRKGRAIGKLMTLPNNMRLRCPTDTTAPKSSTLPAVNQMITRNYSNWPKQRSRKMSIRLLRTTWAANTSTPTSKTTFQTSSTKTYRCSNTMRQMTKESGPPAKTRRRNYRRVLHFWSKYRSNKKDIRILMSSCLLMWEWRTTLLSRVIREGSRPRPKIYPIE